MPIALETVAANGATIRFHRVMKLEVEMESSIARVHVASYPNEQAAIESKPITFRWELGVPLGALTGGLITDQLEQALIVGEGSPFHGGTIVPDNLQTLEGRKLRKLVELGQCCRQAIYVGFTSSALGTPHSYPAKQQDQDNLVASVTESLIPGAPVDWVTPFWCASGDVWSYQPHTAAQIQQVGRDGKAAILAALMKNEQLTQDVAAATAETLDSITWGSI